jgi:glutathione synthase/RimK-type ligase-like ATP-grasp enzyme
VALCVLVSHSNDIHAFGVAKRIRDAGVDVALVETDRLSGPTALSWSPGRQASNLPTADGASVDTADADLVWWRRVEPSTPSLAIDDGSANVVANDLEESLRGIVATRFEGTWVDDPGDVRRAENKLIQLDAAVDAGFAIPATLVSQNPAEVRRFADVNSHIVGKVVRGSNARPLLTVELQMELVTDAQIGLAPAIYQEKVEARRHIRINVYDDVVISHAIESDHLDWRPYADNRIRAVPTEKTLVGKMRALLDNFKLSMGAFDFVERPDGELIFLEVNPQGQFLWLQAATGTDLVQACADHLLRRLV